MKIDFDYFAAWIIQKSSFMKRWYLSITIYFYSKSLKFYCNLWENLRSCFQFAPILEKTNQIPNLKFFNLKWLGISDLVLKILSCWILVLLMLYNILISIFDYLQVYQIQIMTTVAMTISTMMTMNSSTKRRRWKCNTTSTFSISAIRK